MNLSFLSENKSNPALRYIKYHYILQTAGKVPAMSMIKQWTESLNSKRQSLSVLGSFMCFTHGFLKWNMIKMKKKTKKMMT